MDNATLNKILKRVVFLSLLLEVVLFFLPYSWAYRYEDKQEILDLLAWHGYESYIDVYGKIPYLYLAIVTVALIGILFFKNWSRILFFLVIIFSMFLTLFFGFNVSPPLYSAIGYIAEIFYGVIITLVYFTPLNTSFKS